MTSYTKVPRYDLGPVRSRAQRFRDNQGLFFCCLVFGIVTAVGGTLSLSALFPWSNIHNPLAGSLGLAGVAGLWLFTVWLWRAPFYVTVEGQDWDGGIVSGSPAGQLRPARAMWRSLPARERFETQPVIAAAYKAAQLGGEEGAREVGRRRMLLEDVAREVHRRETTARRAILSPEGDDLAVGAYVIEGLRTHNDAVAESDAELRQMLEDLRRWPVDPEEKP